MSEIFSGSITNGVWKFDNPSHFIEWCKKKPSGEYLFREPTSLSDSRRLNQNALYWKRNDQLASAIGYTPDEIHEWIVTDCGFLHEVEILGKPRIVRDSSRDLTKIEFSELMKKQDEIANEYNRDLPQSARVILVTTDPLANMQG